MTFKEKLKMDYPKMIDNRLAGGCVGCPYCYGYELAGGGLCKGRYTPCRECEACWNRTIPGTEGLRPVPKLDEWDDIRWPKKNPHLDGLSAKVTLVDELHGVPNLTEHAKLKIGENVHEWPHMKYEAIFGDTQKELGNAYAIQEFVYKSCLNAVYGKPKINMSGIKQVIFNDPATIVIWADGEKTVVKCQNGEPFDPEKGLAMAITKRALGNKGNYFDEIKKWTKKYDVKSAYPEIVEIHMNETEPAKLEELVQGMVRRRELGRDEV